MKKLILLLIVSFIANLVKAQWQVNSLDSVNITSLAAKDSSVFAGTTGGVYISENYGNTWTFSGFNPNIYKVLTIAKNGTTLFAGSNNSMSYSTNNGGNWLPIFTFTNYPVYSIIVNGSDIFSASNFGVHISTNNGGQWTNVSTGLPQLAPPTLLAANSTAIFTVADSIVFVSTNNGVQWDSANTGLTNNPVHTLAVSGAAIFAGTKNGVFLSINNGGLWTAANTGPPNSPVYSLAVSASGIFAATDSGVFVSSNSGGLWTPINTGLPTAPVKFLAISGTKIFAALSRIPLHTEELWSRPLSEVTSIEEEKFNSHFNIYPNPTSEFLTIENYRNEKLLIEIYSSSGEKVMSKQIENTESLSIKHLPSGMYFVKILSENNKFLSKQIQVMQ